MDVTKHKYKPKLKKNNMANPKEELKTVTAEIATTSVTQVGNAVLERPEKTVYYLIVRIGKEKIVVRTGEETHNKILELTKK